mgnify:CR=1 FL=1
MNEVRTRILYTLCRVLTIASRFVLLLFLTKYAEVSEFTTYYLIINAIIFIGYFSSFEIGTVTSRYFITSKKKDDFFSLHIGYLFITILISVVVFYLYISTTGNDKYIFICTFILFFDVLCKDFERWFVLHKKQLISAISLLIRSSICAYVFILYSSYARDYQIEYLFYSMLLCGLVAFFYGMYFMVHISSGLKFDMNVFFEKHMILDLVRKAIPIFISMILIKALFTVDRNIIDILGSDKNELASYLYYISFSYIILTAVEVLVFSFDNPKLIHAYANNAENSYLIAQFYKMLKKVVVLVTVLYVLISTMSYLFLVLTEKTMYLNYYYNSLLLSFSLGCYSIFQCYKYWFYIHSNDRVNLIASFLVVLVFSTICLSLYVFSSNSISYIVSISLVSSFIFPLLYYRRKFYE